MDLIEKIKELRENALISINNSENLAGIEEIRISLLGKKGALTAILKQMGGLSAEERPIVGNAANETRQILETAIADKLAEIKAQAAAEAMKGETLDITLPGRRRGQASRHPMKGVLGEMKQIFTSMGYTVVDGPEIEFTKYVFDMLNTPEGHPARDEGDTFYIKDDVVLRTQTSSLQIRAMLEKEPPIAIISPGAVYRVDEIDATHSPMFHQCEGMVIGKGITFGDLKGTLEVFMKRLYGDDVRLRFRPHHFPYTEPSAEVDLSCFKCGGKGCPFCKGEGWIEMLGSGVVHEKVLRNCGIDPEIYSGFAFGIGIDRITMMRYAIDDLRLLFENDVRFLRQF